MRKLVIVAFLSVLLVGCDGSEQTQAETTAALPKPWQWKPEKVELKLTASKPGISAGGLGSNILSTRCTPKGRGVADRYSRFTCDTRYGGSQGSETTVLSVRVLPVGSGKFCIVAVTFPEPSRQVLFRRRFFRQAWALAQEARVRLPEPRRNSLRRETSGRDSRVAYC